MKILFVINNMKSAYLDYEHTGVLTSVNRRCVEIELTEDQVKSINLEKTFNGEELETIESVSLKLESNEPKR